MLDQQVSRGQNYIVHTLHTSTRSTDKYGGLPSANRPSLMVEENFDIWEMGAGCTRQWSCRASRPARDLRPGSGALGSTDVGISNRTKIVSRVSSPCQGSTTALSIFFILVPSGLDSRPQMFRPSRGRRHCGCRHPRICDVFFPTTDSHWVTERLFEPGSCGLHDFLLPYNAMRGMANACPPPCLSQQPFLAQSRGALDWMWQ